MRLGHKILFIGRQVFFPVNSCPVCNCPNNSPGPCGECLKKIKNLPRCSCGFILQNSLICPICGEDKKLRPLTGVLPGLFYEGSLRQNIIKFKYGGKTYFARPFAALLEALIREFYPKLQFEAIVPVPLSFKREKERGYNQAELCAGFLGKALDLPHFPKALERVKETPPLAGQTREQRLKYMKKAFIADASQVKGKRILLLDDIFTTGATAFSCGEALLKAGAKEVFALTLAYTPAENNQSTS